LFLLFLYLGFISPIFKSVAFFIIASFFLLIGILILIDIELIHSELKKDKPINYLLSLMFGTILILIACFFFDISLSILFNQYIVKMDFSPGGNNENPEGNSGNNDNPEGNPGNNENPGGNSGNNDNPGGNPGNNENPEGNSGNNGNPEGNSGNNGNPIDNPNNRNNDRDRPGSALMFINYGRRRTGDAGYNRNDERPLMRDYRGYVDRRSCDSRFQYIANK
jgi:hypothetical protein